MTRHVVVDIETNGSNPLMYSMISLGAVVVDDGKITDTSFYMTLRPHTDLYEEEAYKVNGFTHDEAMTFPLAGQQMMTFVNWLKEQAVPGQRLHFVSDNAGFDWMFVCSYLWYYTGENPFGFSPMSLTWYFKGQKGVQSKFGQYRSKKSPIAHTHNALDDAKGNAYALEALMKTDVKKVMRQ